MLSTTTETEQPLQVAWLYFWAIIYVFERTFQNTQEATTAATTMNSVLWDPHNGYYMAVVKRLLLANHTYMPYMDADT